MAERDTAPRTVYLQGISAPWHFPPGTTDEQINAWLRTPDALARITEVQNRSGYLDALKGGGLSALSQMASTLSNPSNEAEAKAVADRLRGSAESAYYGPHSAGDIGRAYSDDGVFSALNALGKTAANVAGVYATPPLVGTGLGALQGGPAGAALGFGLGTAADFAMNAATMPGANVQEQQAANPDEPVNYGAARGTGLAQAAALTGLNFMGGRAGLESVKALVDAGKPVGAKYLAGQVAKTAGTGTVLLPTIQAGTRAQAGEDLASPEALGQYGEAAGLGALLGAPLGLAGGISQRMGINEAIANRGAPESQYFRGPNAPADVLDQRAGERQQQVQDFYSQPPGTTKDMFGGEGALLPQGMMEPAAIDPRGAQQLDLFAPQRGTQGDLFGGAGAAPPVAPKTMAEQLQAYRDLTQQQLMQRGVDEKVAQKTANQMAAKQVKQGELAPELAPQQQTFDAQLEMPRPEVTPAQARMAADQQANAVPHVIDTNPVVRPEQLVGGLPEAQRQQLATEARQTLSRAPMQDNGLVGVPPAVQAQQFAQGMAQTPVGQTADMFNLPTQRAVQLNEPEISHGQNTPENPVEIPAGETVPAQGLVQESGQADAVRQGQIARQPELPFELRQAELPGIETADTVPLDTTTANATTVEPEVIPAINKAARGPAREGESTGEAMARMLANNKADVEAGAPHVGPDEMRAQTANAGTLKKLVPLVNKATPEGGTLADGLRNLLTTRDLPDDMKAAGRTVYRRLTGTDPDATLRGPTEQATFLSQSGKALPKGFQGYPDARGVVQAASKKPRVSRDMAPQNPDGAIGKGRLLAATDIPANGHDAAAWLSRTATEPWQRDLAKRLQPYLKDVPVRLVQGNEADIPSVVAELLNDGSTAGVTIYRPDTKKAEVYISNNPGNMRDDVVMHELLHAATEKALSQAKNANLNRELDGIRVQFLKSFADHPDAKTQAAWLDSPHEFLAYAMTSPTLRDFAKTLDGYGRKVSGTPKFSLWQRLVNMVRKLFGAAPKKLEDMLNSPTGATYVAGTPSEFYKRMDDLLGRVLEARGPELPFSDATRAVAVANTSPTARAVRQLASMTPPDKLELTKELGQRVASGFSHAIDVGANKYFDHAASFEAKMHNAYNGSVTNARGGARADAVLRQVGDAPQMADLALSQGTIKIRPDGLWEVVDNPNNLPAAEKIAVAAASKYGIAKSAISAAASKYGQAYRMDDLSKFVASLEAKLPQGDLGKAEKKAIADQAKQILQDQGHTLSAETQKSIDRMAKKITEQVQLEQSGLTPENARDMRDAISRLSGVITWTPQQIADGLALAKQMPEVEPIRKMLREIVRNAVNAVGESGAFSKDYVQQLNSREGYTSFKRLMDNDPVDFTGRRTNSLRAQPTVAEILGSNEDIGDIFANTKGTVDYLTQLAMRNHAARSMADAAVEHLGGREISSHEVGNSNRDRVVSYLDNGKTKIVEMQDALDADAFRGQSQVQYPLVNAMRSVARFLRTAIVINPSFADRQLIMDAGAAGLMAGVKNPFAVAKDTLGYGVKLMYEAARNRESTDPYLLQLKRLGVTGRYDTVHVADNDILASLRDAPTSVWGHVADKTKNTIHFFEKIASAAEYAQRVAVMKRVAAEGGNTVDQWYRAHEVINYNRRGNDPIMSLLSQTVPFLSAKMSATHLILRTLAGRGLTNADKVTARKRLAANLAMMGAMSTVYAMMTGDNDDIQNMPIEQRYKNMYIPLGNGKLFAIPVRPEPALLFKWMPERLWQLHKNYGLTDDGRNALKDGMHTFADAMLFDAPIPAAAKPIIENAINHSFFTGRPVVSDYMSRMPIAEQFNDSTSAWAKVLGPRVNISPMMLDNLLKGYTGSLTSYANSLSYHLVNQFSESPQPARDWSSEPLVRDFVKNANMSTQSANDFYEMQAQAEGAAAAYKKASDEGRLDDAMTIAADSKVALSYSKQLANTNRQLQQLNMAIRQINASNMDNSSKLLQVQTLKEMRANLTRQVEAMKLQMR